MGRNSAFHVRWRNKINWLQCMYIICACGSEPWLEHLGHSHAEVIETARDLSPTLPGLGSEAGVQFLSTEAGGRVQVYAECRYTVLGSCCCQRTWTVASEPMSDSSGRGIAHFDLFFSPSIWLDFIMPKLRLAIVTFIFGVGSNVRLRLIRGRV